MREHPQAQARTSEEEVDRRTAEVEAGTCIPAQEADTRTAEVEAGTRIPGQEVDRRTAEEEPGRNIPVQVVDSRRLEVEGYSKSWATGTYALSAASGRSNRT